ncbi:MAG TPA: hypothetical protein VFO84_06775 [Dehalococcoidia bacterium]|nr:hypothetical protein [Dehalococcoidia bacterium]
MRLPVGLILLGVASAAVYLYLTVEASFLEHFPGPGFTYEHFRLYGPDFEERAALLLTASAALFGLFALALWLLRKPVEPGPAVVVIGGGAAAFAAILAFMYPPLAVDFVHNVSDARTFWEFGDNPLVTPPNAHPFPISQPYGGQPAPYGPLSFLLFFPVAFFGDEIELALHFLKFYVSLYYLASALLIFLIARRLTPGREVFALALYAWNPFVVLHVAGNGHNDVIMFFFVLLALWLLINGQWRYAIPALVASVLVKYASLIALPPFLLAAFLMAEDRNAFWRETVIGGALAGLLVLVTLGPFWEGIDTFDYVRDQQDKFVTSTPILVSRLLSAIPGVAIAAAGDIARWLGTVAFLAVYLALLAWLWRAKGAYLALVGCVAGAMLALNLLALTWFRPWYLLWPLTLLPLLPGRWPVALIFAISVPAMQADVAEIYTYNADWLREKELAQAAVQVVPTFGPAVAVLVAWWLSRDRFVALETKSEPG